MKIIISFLLAIIIVSCSVTKQVKTNSELAEVLISKEYGGANFEFYETISEPKEFRVLLGDEEIKKFVKQDDINTSNYIIVNLGEKNSGGYGVESVNAVEESSKIIVTITIKKPKTTDNVIMSFTNPYAIIKINSKKTIEIKQN